MKIIHLSTHDIAGGAALSAYRLHKSLQSSGLDSTLLVRFRHGTDNSVKQHFPNASFATKLKRLIHRRVIKRDYARYLKQRSAQSDYFSDDRNDHFLYPLNDTAGHAIIHLHWVTHYFDNPTFFSRCPTKIKIIWTLHDMNAFTGGCHYAGDCRRFTEKCGNCPQLSSSSDYDFSRQIWERKRQAFGNMSAGQLHVVTPSRWLADEAGRSSLLKRIPVSVIPYGLDINTFFPMDKTVARKALGIEPDANVILFLANKVHVRRKGFHFLQSVLNDLNHVEKLTLITVGSGTVQAPRNIHHIHLGKIESNRLLCLIYNSATVFVSTSVQDNLPNTIMESIACGTPVIAFNVGGIPEMVRDKITGVNIPKGDVQQLAREIESALADKDNLSNLSAKCRQIAVQEYDRNLQAQRYVNLYKSIIEHH